MSFMKKWAAACESNPVIALVSLPFIVVVALVTAARLWLRGEKEKARECL